MRDWGQTPNVHARDASRQQTPSVHVWGLTPNVQAPTAADSYDWPMRWSISDARPGYSGQYSAECAGHGCAARALAAGSRCALGACSTGIRAGGLRCGRRRRQRARRAAAPPCGTVAARRPHRSRRAGGPGCSRGAGRFAATRRGGARGRHGGIADELVAEAAGGDLPAAREAPPSRRKGDYDLVVGDLLYSQLLYPALRDTALPRERVGVVLDRTDRPLVASVVRRLHASVARGRAVVHVHDPLGWWDGHVQRVTLEEILEAAATDTAPRSSSSRAATGRAPATRARSRSSRASSPIETAFWRWPFQEGVDYLACATVTCPAGPPLH